jgi:hypothetical protein
MNSEHDLLPKEARNTSPAPKDGVVQETHLSGLPTASKQHLITYLDFDQLSLSIPCNMGGSGADRTESTPSPVSIWGVFPS